MTLEIRSIDTVGTGDVGQFLRARHSALVARRGELVDALARPALAVRDLSTDGERSGDGIVGVLTYDVVVPSCEILTIHVARQWRGIGTALLQEVARIATARGCDLLWVVTTNDNVDALRFYQRRGFRLRAVRCGAVDESRRRLKPEIPVVGDHGIPIRDELELVHELPWRE